MYGISYNAKEDGSEWSKSLGLRLLSVCVCVGVCVRACVCACMCVRAWMCMGAQIAQVLDLLWNNYKIIYFHNRITYISSPGRPSQSSNFNLVRRFRNERAKIITNWKKKAERKIGCSFFRMNLISWITQTTPNEKNNSFPIAYCSTHCRKVAAPHKRVLHTG